MFASNTLELPYCNGIGRQRERGIGALAQVIGKTSITFLRKNIIPAAKRVGADLLEIAVPEAADVVCGKFFSRLLPKASEDIHWENKLEVASKREAF